MCDEPSVQPSLLLLSSDVRKRAKASAHLQPLGVLLPFLSLTGSRRSDLFMRSPIKAALTLNSAFLLPKLGEAALLLLFLCMNQPLSGQQSLRGSKDTLHAPGRKTHHGCFTLGCTQGQGALSIWRCLGQGVHCVFYCFILSHLLNCL